MRISNFKYYTVFLLLIASNIFNILLDRGSTAAGEEEGGSRIIIHILNVGVAFGMMYCYLGQRIPKIFYWVILLIISMLVYMIGYFYFGQRMEYTYTHYFKLFINFLGFPFFYFAYKRLKEQELETYLKAYIITLIAASASKILSSKLFLSDNLGAGDTASIALVFLIPLVFSVFKRRAALILYIIIFILTVVSLRRTCIIAFFVSVPYLLPYLKGGLSFSQRLIILVLICLAGFFAIANFGDLMITRFSEIGEDDGRGVGSGRSIFYLVLLEGYLNDPSKYIFGHGINSVWHYYDINGFYYLPHAHNDFLELLFTFGVWGIFLWCGFLFALYKKRNVKTLSKPEKQLFFLSLVLYFIVALASGTLLRIEMLPIVMSISFLLAKEKKINDEKNSILF
jgi:hypothetical protein